MIETVLTVHSKKLFIGKVISNLPSLAGPVVYLTVRFDA